MWAPTSITNFYRGFLRPFVADRALFRERPFPGFIFYVWRYPFTPAGKAVMLTLALSAAAGSITDEMPLYQIPVTLVVLVLLTSAVGSVLRWLSVSLHGRWPQQVSAGLTVSGEFRVTNNCRLPLFDVSIAAFGWPRSWEVLHEDRIVTTLAPGESARLVIRAIPHQRGLHILPAVRAFSTFPFNLFRNQLGRLDSQPILVLPRFEPLTRVNLEIGHRYQPGGIVFSSQIGEAPEYIGNRDYLPGDSPRHIDFRSWARLAKPIVREYHEEYFHRLGLILDTFVPRARRAGRGGYPDLEAAISLTAAVADVFSRGEHLLDVFAAGPELHIFRTGRSHTPQDAVLEILACVPPCRSNHFERLAAALSGEFPNISSVVCIFLDWDESRHKLVQAALDAGCNVKVVIIRREQSRAAVDLTDVDVLQVTPQQVNSGLGEL